MYRLQGTIHESLRVGSHFLKDNLWLKGVRIISFDYVAGGSTTMTIDCSDKCRLRTLVPALPLNVKPFVVQEDVGNKVFEEFSSLISKDIHRSVSYECHFKNYITEMNINGVFDCLQKIEIKPDRLSLNIRTDAGRAYIGFPISTFKLFLVKLGEELFGGYALNIHDPWAYDAPDKTFRMLPKKTEVGDKFVKSLEEGNFEEWLKSFKVTVLKAREKVHERFLKTLDVKCLTIDGLAELEKEAEKCTSKES